MADRDRVQVSKIIHDEDFYLQSAIFLVEDRHFKVPVLHFAEESEVFRSMFQLPQAPHGRVDGMTDEQPIVLEGVKKEDFKQLLRIMYSRKYREEEKLTTKEWASVLLLSSKWDMDVFRRLAIKKITPELIANPHELVLWGQKFNVDPWLFRGIQGLVDRESPMDEEDVKILGLSIILKISATREWTHANIENKLKATTPIYKMGPIEEAATEEVTAKILAMFHLNLDLKVEK